MVLEKLFGRPEISGLESDAFWMGLFLGLFTSVSGTTVLAFVLLPTEAAFELLPFVLVVGLALAYPLARGWIRLLLGLVNRFERRQREPTWQEE